MGLVVVGVGRSCIAGARLLGRHAKTKGPGRNVIPQGMKGEVVAHLAGLLDDFIPLGRRGLQDVHHSNENIGASSVIPRHVDLGRHREG